MNLKWLISIALCHLVSGRSPHEHDELDEALSNLQLLIPLLIDDNVKQLDRSLAADSTYQQRAHSPSSPPSSAPSPAYKHHAQQNNQHSIYSADGPFSDIPSDQFKLDQHRKEFMFTDKNQNKNRDSRLSQNKYETQRVNDVPNELIEQCMKYFEGTANPELSTVELILNVCTELLDSAGVEEMAGAGARCECPLRSCPVLLEPAEIEIRTDDLDDEALGQLLKLFKPVSQYSRRNWIAMNTDTNDSRLKQYVNLKDSAFVI